MILHYFDTALNHNSKVAALYLTFIYTFSDNAHNRGIYFDQPFGIYSDKIRFLEVDLVILMLILAVYS